MQTVTTVGYGDVAPKEFTGRLVGAVVMLEGIAFVPSRQSEAAEKLEDLSDRAVIEMRFDELERKLDRLAAGREGPRA